MAALSKQTAMDIALAHREMETATALLAEIEEALGRRQAPDIRDAFGRRQEGLQLGVPHGNNGHRLFNVPWVLAKPVIEAHIAQQRSIIASLSEVARLELHASQCAEASSIPSKDGPARSGAEPATPMEGQS